MAGKRVRKLVLILGWIGLYFHFLSDIFRANWGFRVFAPSHWSRVVGYAFSGRLLQMPRVWLFLVLIAGVVPGWFLARAVTVRILRRLGKLRRKKSGDGKEKQRLEARRRHLRILTEGKKARQTVDSLLPEGLKPVLEELEIPFATCGPQMKKKILPHVQSALKGLAKAGGWEAPEFNTGAEDLAAPYSPELEEAMLADISTGAAWLQWIAGFDPEAPADAANVLESIKTFEDPALREQAATAFRYVVLYLETDKHEHAA